MGHWRRGSPQISVLGPLTRPTDIPPGPSVAWGWLAGWLARMSVEYLNGHTNSAWAHVGPLGSYEPETAPDMAVESIYPFALPPLTPLEK